MPEPKPHAVITGSASGIGRALTERLLDKGWEITGIDRNPHPPEIAGRIAAVEADLSEADFLDRVRIEADGTPVTAFVHAAGIMRGDGDPATDSDLGSAMWRLHAGSAAALIRRLERRIPDRRGRIVLFSSRAEQGRAGRVFYAATKAGVSGLGRSFAAEFVHRGITVNTVAPGTTATPMLADPARAGVPVLPLPLGRLVEPGEVAALVEFLVGPEAGAITGQTIYVCGGSSIPGVTAAKG